MAIAGNRQAEQLKALDYVLMGSRVAVLVWDKCEQWPLRRSDHLGAIATVRREAYTNDHWPMAGSTLMTVRYPQAGWFQRDPSQIVRDPGCRHEGWSVRAALTQSAARRVRLSVADRHAARSRAIGSRDGEPVWAGEGSILLENESRSARPAKHRDQTTPRTASAPGR